MVLASMRAADGRLVSPWWLVAVYLLHAVGELSFSPVGYSLVTKLSPPSMVSQLLGVWLTSIALGNLIASRVAGQVGLLPLPQLFAFVARGDGRRRHPVAGDVESRPATDWRNSLGAGGRRANVVRRSRAAQLEGSVRRHHGRGARDGERAVARAGRGR